MSESAVSKSAGHLEKVCGHPLSHDTLWNGALHLWQPAKGAGYRFNLDAVVLAVTAASAAPIPKDGAVWTPRHTAHMVDLGAGCGVVGLVLLTMGAVAKVTAIERQPALAALARHNGKANGFGEDRFRVIEGDVRDIALAQDLAQEGVDGWMANPPYYQAHACRPSWVPGRDQARAERFGGLPDFLRFAHELSGNGKHPEGTIILPEHRWKDLKDAVAKLKQGIEFAQPWMAKQDAKPARRFCARVHATEDGLDMAQVWADPFVLGCSPLDWHSVLRRGLGSL